MATKLRILVGALLLAGAVLVPTPAHAKGAGSAEVSGPGLDQPIEFDRLELSANQLASVTGLSVVVWGHPLLAAETAGVVEDHRPAGRLGPRYVVTYEWMVGQDEDLGYIYEPIRQRLYPFARDGTVTYVPPGQRLFDEPVGTGWYRAGAELRDMLVAAGVPQPRRR